MSKNCEKVQELMDRQKEWSDQTFSEGKFLHARSLPISFHLQKEAAELTEALQNYINDPTEATNLKVSQELADVFLLLLDCTAHVGFSVESLTHFASCKFMLNKTREWGSPDENGVVEHVRG